MSAFGGISIHTHTLAHTRARMHTHTHIRTHTHTPTHTFTHTTHHTTPHTFPRIISLFCPSPVADAFAPAQGMMDVRHERSSGLFSPRIIASPCHRHAIAMPLPCNCQVSSPWLRHVIVSRPCHWYISTSAHRQLACLSSHQCSCVWFLCALVCWEGVYLYLIQYLSSSAWSLFWLFCAHHRRGQLPHQRPGL